MSDELEKKDQDEYDLMMALDELETLKEEMEELGVSTLAEVQSRIQELHSRLDDRKK